MRSGFIKWLMVWLLALALSGTATAQRAGETTTPSDVVIGKFAWQPYLIRPDWDKDMYRTGTQAANADRAQREQQKRPGPHPDEVTKMPEVNADSPAQGTKGFQYRVAVKNVGKKTIEAVEWQYVFTNPDNHPDDKQAETRHPFVNRQRIKPGKTKELLQFSTMPPTAVLNARTAGEPPPTHLERVEITRIEYSDGSVWQRP